MITCEIPHLTHKESRFLPVFELESFYYVSDSVAVATIVSVDTVKVYKLIIMCELLLLYDFH